MIEFHDVVKNFGERKVLKGISFDVPKGGIFFILGTSGTGKSVLLKSIVGLLKVTSGQIKIAGQDVCLLDEKEMFPIRRRCGMVFQQPALFDSLSVFENIAFGLRKHHPELPESEVTKQVRECLSLVRLQSVEQKMPQEISFGMQKRVSLARTLAVKPEILLFDEPTTGLDPVTTNSINFLIQDLSRRLKTTSVIVSHDIQCALDIADQILFLHQGEIVARGTSQEIKSSQHSLVQDFLKEVSHAASDH